MMDDDAEAQSLFLVVDYDFHIGKRPYFCSILQLDMSNQGKNQVVETKFSVNFCLPPPPQPPLADAIIWSYSPLSISSSTSTHEVYMVPDMVPELYGKLNEQPVSLQGCIYNLRNNTCKKINHPKAPKHSGCVVSMKGHLYFMAHPRGKYLSFPVFERHDPFSDCWEPLQPFPHLDGLILATAVLDDTILFNILGFNICAYYVPHNKWCPVIVDQDLSYCITGEAVVLGNTIYALEERCFNLVLVFSVGREEINGDLVFRFSLVSEILVAGINEIKVEDEDVLWPSELRNLAFLGNNNFCLVQNCELSCPNEYQSIQVINMKLLEGENLMIVTNTRFYKLKIDGNAQFYVRLCIPSPLNCTTTAVEEFQPSVVEFDPFPKHTGLKLKREEEGEGEDNTDCHGDHVGTTLAALNHDASPLQTQTQATPTPACPAIPAYHYLRTPAIPSPPPYCQQPHYPNYPQAPAIPSLPPYYQLPAYHYPQAPAIPSLPPYYQLPAYHYPQAPAIPSLPPYYPNTPQPLPFSLLRPLVLTPTAPKTNNERPPNQDCCQLCGLQGHFATNCSTYTYHKHLPGSPRSTTLNPLMQEEKITTANLLVQEEKIAEDFSIYVENL